MKSIPVIFFLVASILPSIAQRKPPEVVLSAFKQKFPDATDVKWEKENATEYEANFQNVADKCSANFTVSGKWLELETIYSFSDLPDQIQAAFNKAYPQVKIKGAAKIDHADGTVEYEMEVKQKGRTVEFFYNITGTEIKK